MALKLGWFFAAAAALCRLMLLLLLDDDDDDDEMFSARTLEISLLRWLRSLAGRLPAEGTAGGGSTWLLLRGMSTA